jgi:hypothetical protein
MTNSGRTHTFRGALVAVLIGAAWAAHAAEVLRPEVGKPLQAAQSLIKAQKYKDALAKVREAEAVGGKTAQESFTIDRMRLAAAAGAGDLDTTIKAFEALNASGRLAQAEKLSYLESISGTAFRSREYAKAKQWGQRYLSEGGTSAGIRTVVAQSDFLSGDYAGVIKNVTAEIQLAEKNKTAPSEDRIKLLLNAANKVNDTDRYVFGVEKLLTYYPKKEYWGELITHLKSKPQFGDRLALDTYRLALATDSLNGAQDYVEMAQLAAQAGYPAEGKKVVEKGYAAGVLGTGPDAARHKRLRDLLDKRVGDDRAAWADTEAKARGASDGNALVQLGFNQVVTGEVNKGVSLIQEGVNKSDGKSLESAKLRLGIAQALSGNTANANATFRSIAGRDGVADLARLWSLYVRGKSNAA